LLHAESKSQGEVSQVAGMTCDAGTACSKQGVTLQIQGLVRYWKFEALWASFCELKNENYEPLKNMTMWDSNDRAMKR
jgi:hypothetical protein